MSYMNVYLRFPDKATCDGLLFDEDGIATHSNMDIIGIIYTGGTYDSEGNVITPPVASPGYHCNLRLHINEALAASLEVYSIETPLYRKHMFFGE